MSAADFQELDALLEQLCDGLLETDQVAVARLIELLDQSEDCRRRYLDMLELHAALWRSGAEAPPAIPRLVDSPGISILNAAHHITVSFFSQEVPFACFIALFVMGIGLIIGANVYVSHPEPRQVARDVQDRPSVVSHEPMPEPVGRITGMVDCRWSIDGQPIYSNKVPVGRKFKLDSGLMEITYDSGAKVILQGPCNYEVNSPGGGFLTLGKLTARVDSGQQTVNSAKPQVSDIHHSAFSTHHSPNPSPLFTVQTPTAVITDLGTEFGVEVDDVGATISHVFQGMVLVHQIGAGGKCEDSVELAANESVRVDNRHILSGDIVSSSFVRSLPQTNAGYLTAWYKFDEIKDGLVLRTPDSSGHGRSGALIGMTQANLTPGIAGNALAFNVEDNLPVQSVTMPWSPVFDLAGKSFTIALWLKRLAVGPEEHEIIVHKERGREGGYAILRDQASGRLVFRARNSHDESIWVAAEGDGNDAPQGIWVHFAVVGSYDSATNSYEIDVYHNGVRVGRQSRVELAPTYMRVSIGADEGIGWPFRGLVDDLQIYHRALGDDEIAAMFERPGEPSSGSSDERR